MRTKHQFYGMEKGPRVADTVTPDLCRVCSKSLHGNNAGATMCSPLCRERARVLRARGDRPDGVWPHPRKTSTRPGYKYAKDAGLKREKGR
jgi:hypothetical protein